jgi:hypothetical protein
MQKPGGVVTGIIIDFGLGIDDAGDTDPLAADAMASGKNGGTNATATVTSAKPPPL